MSNKILVMACLIAALAAAEAEAGLILHAEEFHPSGVVGVTTTTESFIEYNGGASSSITGSASASLSALGASVRMPGNVSAWGFRSGFTLHDVVFSADIPGTSIAEFSFGGDLDAVLSGATLPGTFNFAAARVSVLLTVQGNPGYQFLEEESVGTDGGDFSREINSFAGRNFSATVGVPIDVSATLEVQGNTGIFSEFASSDAANTFQLNPLEFFDIQTPGVTANAGNFLVNNQLPGFLDATPVPEPGSLALLGLGALALCGYRRRSRRQPSAAGRPERP